MRTLEFAQLGTIDFSDWENEIIEFIENECEVTRSDAQGIVEAQQSFLDDCWSKSFVAEDTARAIIDLSIR